MNRESSQNQSNLSFLNNITSSKRLALTYIVLGVWLALAVFGILIDTDLYALAVYFASGLPIILGYLWSETSRPTMFKSAADIVKNINRPNIYNGNSNCGNYGNNYGNYGSNYENYRNYGNYGNIYSGNYENGYDYNENQNLASQISILSDDFSIELKVNDNQFSTLQNLGYINNNGTKYTFIKSQINEIKSIISDNLVDPMI